MLAIKPNSFCHNVDTKMQLTALTFNWNLLKCFSLSFRFVCFVSNFEVCFLFSQRIGPAECPDGDGDGDGDPDGRSVGQFSNSARSSIAITDHRSTLFGLSSSHLNFIYISVYIVYVLDFFLRFLILGCGFFCVNVLIDRFQL